MQERVVASPRCKHRNNVPYVSRLALFAALLAGRLEE